MNDDITSREIELVTAILDSLLENSEVYLLKSLDPQEESRLQIRDEAYGQGYQAAQEIVADVLRERGFDIEWVDVESEK